MNGKILILSHRSRRGGAEKVLLDYLEKTVLPHELIYVVSFEDGELITRSKELGYKTMVINSSSRFNDVSRKHASIFDYIKVFGVVLRIIFQTLRYVISNHITLIYANTTKATFVGSIVAFLSRRRLVVRLHEILDSREFNAKSRAIMVYICKYFATRILTVSHAVEESLVNLGVKRSKITTIYNGVDISSMFQFKLSKQDFGLVANQPCAVVAGRLTPWKGQEYAILAWIEVVKVIPNAVLLIVGNSNFDLENYEAKLIDLTRGNDLVRNIKFLGYREDVLQIMALSDLVLHTSIAPDPLPTVLLEARALGKYAIATDVGGVREIIDDVSVGLIIKPANANMLARSIIDSLTTRRTRNINVPDKFSMTNYVHALDQILAK